MYAIGEDDYAFWDLLFGKRRKKEMEKWRSLKARMDDPDGPEPKSSNHGKMSGRQPGGETNASCSTNDPG